MAATGSVVIANGQTKSSSINAGGRSLLRVSFPTMTGTSVTVQGSDTDVDADFKTIGDIDTAVSITSPSTRAVTIPPQLTYGFTYLRLVSSGAEGAERTIPVFLQDYLG